MATAPKTSPYHHFLLLQHFFSIKQPGQSLQSIMHHVTSVLINSSGSAPYQERKSNFINTIKILYAVLPKCYSYNTHFIHISDYTLLLSPFLLLISATLAVLWFNNNVLASVSWYLTHAVFFAQHSIHSVNSITFLLHFPTTGHLLVTYLWKLH